MRFRTRPHFARNLTLVVLAGAVAGFAAVGKVGPFHTLGVTGHTVAATLHQAPLSADQFFPAPTDPAATKHVMVVQDPPTQANGPATVSTSGTSDDLTEDMTEGTTEDATEAGDSTAAATEEPTATAATSGAVTPTPCHEDGCGGGRGD